MLRPLLSQNDLKFHLLTYLRLVMHALGGGDPNYLWKGLSLGFLVILANVWYTLWYGVYIKQASICGMNVRSCLTGALYRKVTGYKHTTYIPSSLI